MNRRPPVPCGITPDILDLCADLVPDVTPAYLPVTPSAGAMPRHCFPAVDAMINDKGGTCQCGWQIWEWPYLMLEAEFHGVWVGPNGQYVDVTPKEPPVSEILFLPDNRRRYQGKPIHNVRRPLRRSDLIMEYIRVCDELDHERDKGEYHVETLRVSYPQDIHDRIQEIEEKRSRLEDLVQEELYQFLKDLRKQRGSGG